MLTKDKNGKIVCVECKASNTAPLTSKQKIAFPEIKKTGGTIVGKGKPGFEGGTKIPPTEVKIVRPTTKIKVLTKEKSPTKIEIIKPPKKED